MIAEWIRSIVNPKQKPKRLTAARIPFIMQMIKEICLAPGRYGKRGIAALSNAQHVTGFTATFEMTFRMASS